MTLWIYIARRMIVTTMLGFLAVMLLSMLVDILELARKAGDRDVGFLVLIGLAAMRAPSIAMVAAPYIVLLSAMWTGARLARSSELVVMRAAGVSSLGLAAPIVTAAALMGLIGATMFNPFSAALLDRFERLEAQLLEGEQRLLSVSREGLWLRQGNFARHSVIRARTSNSDGTELGEVTILFFEDEDLFVGRTEASRATLQPGFWRLEDARIWRLDPANPTAPPDFRARSFFDLQTDLTADQILDSFAPPETIQFWELPALIRTLEKQGFSARRHVLHFHALLASPLVFAAMALIGAAFSMRHARFGGLGIMALYAALTGFGTFFVLSVAKALASSGAAPAIPAAWAPPFAAMLLAIGLLLKLEDA